MHSYRHTIVIVIVLLQASLAAQVSAAAPGVRQVAEPRVPSDPLELVTGDAQPVQDVSQRAEINLLINANRRSNVRAQGYDLKTKFTASGSSAADGMWRLEDTSPGPGLYRWTAQGPSIRW